MFRKIGFKTGDTSPAAQPETPGQPEPQQPIRCIAYVRFDGIRKAYAYYNDRFCLQEGDTVFVSGKLAGKPGIVEGVQTHFRIRLSDYERVISRAEGAIRGHFRSLCDKMLCTEQGVLPPEVFRTWVLPPVDDPENILLGEGFRVDLDAFESDEQMPRSAIEKAVELCRSGRVVYLHLENGKGTAFLAGEPWTEVDFTLSEGAAVSDLFCDCLYPENGICEHMAAVLLTLRALLHSDELQNADNFVALDRDWFWKSVSDRSEVKL